MAEILQKQTITKASRSTRAAILSLWHHLLASSTRSKVTVSLIVIGAALLAYVGSQYWSMYSAQERLQAQWQQQQQPTAPAPPVSGTDSHNTDPLLTRLRIPRINLDAIVVEGDSRKQLLLGPGHITQTAFPGETGNSVITGHRDTFFRHIFELNRGDEILVDRNKRTFHYRVTGKRVVQPEDVGVLRPTTDTELTLITCYPTYYVGPAPERLVVFSRLVEDPALQDAKTAAY